MFYIFSFPPGIYVWAFNLILSIPSPFILTLQIFGPHYLLTMSVQKQQNNDASEMTVTASVSASVQTDSSGQENCSRWTASNTMALQHTVSIQSCPQANQITRQCHVTFVSEELYLHKISPK